jgi:hypothetical protein
MSRGTSVASLMVVGPCVEVKAVKGDALRSDRDDSDVRADFPVEPVLVHTEIRRCVPKSNETWGADVRFDGGRTGFRCVRSCTGLALPIVDHVRGFGSRVVGAAVRYISRCIPAEGITGGPRFGADVICLSPGSSRGQYRRRATRGRHFATSRSAGRENAVAEGSERTASAL